MRITLTQVSNISVLKFNGGRRYFTVTTDSIGNIRVNCSVK